MITAFANRIQVGLNSRDLTGSDVVIAWIKSQDLGDLKILSGKEAGVIEEFWQPGGLTSGGMSEAIADLSKTLPFEAYPF